MDNFFLIVSASRVPSPSVFLPLENQMVPSDDSSVSDNSMVLSDDSSVLDNSMVLSDD
jgi:hypothetical protein